MTDEFEVFRSTYQSFRPPLDTWTNPAGGSWAGDLPPVNPLSVAPMMDVTDRHFRFLMRLLTKRTKLYTEMAVDQTLLYNPLPRQQEYFLGHGDIEHPLAIQLGGNDPELVGQAAKMCETFGGFDEINLNCGCPSPKVSKRCFGARLMLDPERVRRIVSTMGRQVCRTEVTVKCRIGVDQRDSYPELCEFVVAVRSCGVRHLIVHARKCLLEGLSTSENRSVPPLRYEVVDRLIRDFPDMRFTLNGGVKTLEATTEHLTGGTIIENPAHGWEEDDVTRLVCRPVHGVMIGRAAWHNPWMMRHADVRIFGAATNPDWKSRREVVREYVDYAEALHERYGTVKDFNQDCYGYPANVLIRPLIHLFAGQPNCARFKQRMCREWELSKVGNKGTASVRDLLDAGLEEIPVYVLDSTHY